MTAVQLQLVRRIEAGQNVWLSGDQSPAIGVGQLPVYAIRPDVLETEDAVGRIMLDELLSELEEARRKGNDLVIALLGGRGAQAMHKLLGDLARKDEVDHLLAHLHIFTQDALAPMRADSPLSFLRDFERLLGDAFFKKVKSFNPIRTDVGDIEAELRSYLERLNSLGGIGIFFMGLGPEPGGASHLAYIRPGSGAMQNDLAGIIPISSSILNHHISKFKAGGTVVTPEDEAECRKASHILTLGPASILSARRVIQSVVDASTATGKRESYRRLVDTAVSDDPEARAAQLDQNPGLWLRLHPNVRSLILPDVLAG